MYAAARGAKQSGRTGWSDSDDGRVGCAGETSFKSYDRENGYENRESFLATTDPLRDVKRTLINRCSFVKAMIDYQNE